MNPQDCIGLAGEGVIPPPPPVSEDAPVAPEDETEPGNAPEPADPAPALLRLGILERLERHWPTPEKAEKHILI